MGTYAFDRSWGPEEQRLAGLERQLDLVSQAVLLQLGLSAGWRCWEVGAGRGSMAVWLARQVTAGGSVLASDVDISGLADVDHGNIAVVRHDLERDSLPGGGFDLIHARLVLEHLREPAAAIGNLAAALGRGGWLVVEDADGLLFDAEPAAAALSAIAGPWHRAALAAGWDPRYGRRLVTDLRRAGLDRVAGRAHRSYEPGGEAWIVARLGLERLRDQIRHAGASQDDLNDALTALADPGRVIIGGPIVTAWGQRRS
jgi:SAM-dependent methyltransferase